MLRSKRNPHTGIYRQLGFSLVELMVSIVIGLIILAGVVQVVFTSKATFLAQEDMSYIQENARYALNVIGKDVRGAGYWGCSASTPNYALVVQPTADPDAVELVSVEGITGYTADSTSKFPVVSATYTRWPPAGTDTAVQPRVHQTDSFIARYSGGVPLTVLNDDGSRAIMQLEGKETIDAGDFLTVTSRSCDSMGVFNVKVASNFNNGSVVQHTISYASDVNCTTKIKLGLSDSSFDCNAPDTSLGTFYLPGATVMKYVSRGYYIEESNVLPGQPALKRKGLTQTGGTLEEEIALGVEDMLVLYGVQTTNGAGVQVVQLKTADEIVDWLSVTSVQINLLFRSQSQSLPQASGKVYLGNTYTDRYMRQVVTSTFNLRNRI